VRMSLPETAARFGEACSLARCRGVGIAFAASVKMHY